MFKTQFILLSFFGFLILASCSQSDQEKSFLKDMNKEEPVQEAFNVKFIFSESAVIQGMLKAPHVLEIKEDGHELSYFDQGLYMEFYTPEGVKKSEMTANSGKFKKRFGSAEVRGNVVVINEGGEKIETEKLLWNKKEDYIFTDEFVKIQTENEIIYGDSLEANTDFTKYKIFNIRGSISLKEPL